MSIPKQREIELPLLDQLMRAPKGLTRPKIQSLITEHFGSQLTTSDLQATHPTGANKWIKQIQWSQQRLKVKKDIEAVPGRRGAWRITSQGLERLKSEQGGDGAIPGQRYWWVNQGASYEAEKDGGYLWAPTTSQSGALLGHHHAVAELTPGDVVLHYANGTLRAVSRVVSQPRETPRPPELPPKAWVENGYQADVEYSELVEQIPLESIPEALRLPNEDSPFTTAGGIKQDTYTRSPRALLNRWPNCLSNSRKP